MGIHNCIHFQGEKELQVSLFQSLVLLLFNSADKLPLTHIKEVTQIGRFGCITAAKGVGCIMEPPIRDPLR